MSARATLYTKFRGSSDNLRFARDREASATGDFPGSPQPDFSSVIEILFALVTRYTAE